MLAGCAAAHSLPRSHGGRGGWGTRHLCTHYATTRSRAHQAQRVGYRQMQAGFWRQRLGQRLKMLALWG